MNIVMTFYQTSLGLVFVGYSNKMVCSILFGFNGDKEKLIAQAQGMFPGANLIDGSFESYSETANLIRQLMNGKRVTVDVWFENGTAFQRKVWKALMEIPFGTTTTYSEIAQRIGNPKAVRAVASACKMNPIAMVVPCHRVVPKNQKKNALGRYRWGIERKRSLLIIEGVTEYD